MTKALFLVLILTEIVFAVGNHGKSSSLNVQDPARELAVLEAQLASAKESGREIDPALQQRVRELVPLIKGHAGNIKVDASASPQNVLTLEEDGYGTPAVIRPTELTPLETRIRDLEFEMSGGNSLQGVDPVTFANLKEQLQELYAQRPENQRRNSLDQGSPTCPATAIPGLPYTDSGATNGMGSDFNPLLPCSPNTASNDVIYSFTPTITQSYNVSLLGSLFDTYLYVNTGGACPGNTQVACNDDYVGLQSFVSLQLNAGQTYYIIVDGADTGQQGAYVLNLYDNCFLSCQPTDVLECASEINAPGNETNDCNGGCQNTLFGGNDSYQNLHPCQTVCGRGFNYTTAGGNPYRDLDTYMITLTEPCSLAVTVNSEFGAQVIVTAPTCPNTNLYISPQWMFACSSVTFISPCLQAGSYRVIIAPPGQTGVRAMREYRARVDLIPCSGCKVDGFLQAPGVATGNTCGAGNENSLRSGTEITYCLNIPYYSDWSFSLCGGESSWDSYLFLSTRCNNGVIALNDDGCGGVGLSVISCVPLAAGTYYLTVESYNSNTCGPYTLSITECLGSCCYGDPISPSCDFSTLTDCNTVGGIFTESEPCSSGACYTRPSCLGSSSVFSQLPAVPDESWGANMSDYDGGYVQYEDFSVSADIYSLKFWGIMQGAAECGSDSTEFEVAFYDSVNNVSQIYNLTLLGTEVGPVYPGMLRVKEYTAYLNPPCTIDNGFLLIAETTAPCSFYWFTTVLGSGVSAWESEVGGTPYQTGIEFAFCLGERGCIPADSVTIELFDGGSNPNYYTLRWSQPEGTVHLWWSSDPNAVFPDTYSQFLTSYLPAADSTTLFRRRTSVRTTWSSSSQ
jgi:hypothetical protein